MAEWRDVTWVSQEGECLRGIWYCPGLFAFHVWLLVVHSDWLVCLHTFVHFYNIRLLFVLSTDILTFYYNLHLKWRVLKWDSVPLVTSKSSACVKCLISENVTKVLTSVNMNLDNIIPTVTEKITSNRNYTDAAQHNKMVILRGKKTLALMSLAGRGKKSLLTILWVLLEHSSTINCGRKKKTWNGWLRMKQWRV